MRRRSILLGVLAGSLIPRAFASPPAGRKIRVGVLVATTQPQSSARQQFAEPLRRHGYIEGQNLELDYRYADNQYERLDALARELVDRRVDVIVAGGTPPTLAARKATRTIPIISVGGASPVGLGLAASLARPGGNVTGVINAGGEVMTKGMELLRAMAPQARRVGLFMNPDNPASAASPQWLRDHEKEFGVELVPITFREPADLERELGGPRARRVDAAYLRLDATLNANVERFAQFTLSQRIPTMGSLRRFVESGGLASYGQSYEEQWNNVAEYVDRIANGANVGELPIMAPTRFELAVNRSTALAIGVRIPQELLVRADLVIG